MRTWMLGAIALSAACGKLAVTEYEPHTGIITGTVLFQSSGASTGDACTPVAAGGNAVILLFREDDPPPPEGTGSPVNFIVVPESRLFREGSQGGGLFAAPFVIPTVPSGRYTVRGFLDADKDFRPTIDLLAQPTAGDVGGAHVDPTTREILTVEVAQDRVTPQVTVTLALPIPAERPAFAITSTPGFTVPFAAPETLVIEAHAIDTTDIHMSPACTRFLVSYVDENGDGVPDDQNGDHLPDVYPRVVLRQRGRTADQTSILIPAIINPLPFLDALSTAPYVPTSTLELIIPPVAVERGATDTLLPAIPPGEYETIVISGTGQTWQVPNDLARLQPDDPPDPTQAQIVTMSEGSALPAGAISGTVRTAADAQGDVDVIAFDATDPPPPAGSGRPRGFTTVPRGALAMNGAEREGSFAIRGLPDGVYLVIGILDADGDLSPLADLFSQPSAGDVGGRAPSPVTVSGGDTGGVVVELASPFPFDRPAFSHSAGVIPRTGFPAIIETDAHAIDALGITLESARVPVALAGTDLEGDNLPDLYPRVILTQIASEGDARIAPDTGVIIPGIVDPLPYLAALGGGTPFVPADHLRIILPPVALAGTERLSPPPAGRYRVNVLSASGQTWSVPNALDLALGRAGGPREDPTQSAIVTIDDTPVPGGAITGTVRLLVAEPAGDYQVVVFAFASDRPPPPLGAGRPVATAVVSKAQFSGGVAAYALGGLATGTYQVRAFLDSNDDFVPWFDTMNQPDGGDVGGGYLDLATGALKDLDVNALGAPLANKEVSIVDALVLPTDRPSFWIPTPLPVLDPSAGPVSVSVNALRETTDIVTTNGIFPIQWVDLDRDGVGDDINGDGNPDVYPIVIAELLDPEDPDHLALSPDGVRIPGIINPGQFAPLGFPANDPLQVEAVVPATTATVVFPPQAVRAAAPGTPIIPPNGLYRITLINPAGQTWTLPNELVRAAGTPFTNTQGGYLTVRD